MRYMLTESQASYFSKLYEQLNNIIFIKVHAINNEFIQRLEKEFKYIFKVTLDYQKVNYIFSSMDSAVLSFAQICIFIMGGLSVIKGKLTIGQLTIILSYFNVMMESASYFFSFGKTIQENKVAYIRLKKIMSQQTNDENGEILQYINNIELKNINFFYSKKIIFKNFNYTFVKGNIYSIIGSNGSGKSTLIKLILGLFNKEIDGEIYYNGKIIWKLNNHEIRKRCFGISEQEPILLPDTLKYNIVLDDNKDLDLNELYYIAENINLKTLLEKLPMGVETIINEKNSNFSGGEKQKISIARVFYKNPSVIIMDEPTSALDDKSSECLKKYLYQIKDDKINIIITHNPIFLSISDYVLNLEDQLEG